MFKILTHKYPPSLFSSSIGEIIGEQTWNVNSRHNWTQMAIVLILSG